MDGYRILAEWQMTEPQEIDREIAEKMRCPKCKAPCRYEGYASGTGYVALAVCTKCGHETEF